MSNVVETRLERIEDKVDILLSLFHADSKTTVNKKVKPEISAEDHIYLQNIVNEHFYGNRNKNTRKRP